MYTIRKSTATTVHIFAHDSSGNPVLGLLTGDWTWRISKNSGAFGAMTVTTTELEAGWYSLALTTGHTDTTGILSMYGVHASCMQVNLQFRVETRLADELAFPTVSGRSVDVDSTGTVGVDFNNVVGTLAAPANITGIEAIVAAQSASLALAAYDPPTNAELNTAVTTINGVSNALAASLALTAYAVPTLTQLTAGFAALNDITAADVGAITIDGAVDLELAIKRLLAYGAGKVTVSGNAYTYYAVDGSTPLFTLTASTTMRTNS